MLGAFVRWSNSPCTVSGIDSAGARPRDALVSLRGCSGGVKRPRGPFVNQIISFT